jgi:hypothetical protein
MSMLRSERARLLLPARIGVSKPSAPRNPRVERHWDAGYEQLRSSRGAVKCEVIWTGVARLSR